MPYYLIARGINCHILEPGLHIETKDYDFHLVADSFQAFQSQAQAFLEAIQKAGPAPTEPGHPVLSMTPGADRSYLHISVHAHRCIDLTWLDSKDFGRFTAAFGAPESISPGEGFPSVKVMCYQQLKGRLRLSTGDVTVVAKRTEAEAAVESEAGEHAAGVGSEEMGSEEAGCYFPLEFTIDSMPTWRVKKDQRQLVKLQLAEKFDAIRMRKKKKRKKGPEEGAVSPR